MVALEFHDDPIKECKKIIATINARLIVNDIELLESLQKAKSKRKIKKELEQQRKRLLIRLETLKVKDHGNMQGKGMQKNKK